MVPYTSHGGLTPGGYDGRVFLHGAHGPIGIALLVGVFGLRILMRSGWGPFAGMRRGRGRRGPFL
jgi:hypothetical protein